MSAPHFNLHPADTVHHPLNRWSTFGQQSEAIARFSNNLSDLLMPRPASASIPKQRLPIFDLPPLPPIHDPLVLKTVFTDRSALPRVGDVFDVERKEMRRGFEDLEHIGASVLVMFLAGWLCDAKPHLDFKLATKLKESIISNVTLSHLSSIYGLPERLDADPTLLSSLQSRCDIRSALFEAYIAGVYLSASSTDGTGSRGPALVCEWLKGLFGVVADWYEESIRGGEKVYVDMSEK
ncbi:hypothetical protein L202_05992 [Cryptococcus amylolentus CBS 6039]|uniref:RNase III domain-containing protein n=2 Tax=Cryptococcus amylolentus TaxID=104669 RepID=A0A1E3HI69_9TREE|nr:hypothetical protein L202_05992 [Cryptococcus amylolentus CBS 6039]ODN76047.1 hypothetical protein L202_05992 [Cryptococcus amylolentus CBS 6039]ODN97150.1 hypothetical protein I350_08130 [Cryptococcus amylolentus CBS 6273]